MLYKRGKCFRTLPQFYLKGNLEENKRTSFHFKLIDVRLFHLCKIETNFPLLNRVMCRENDIENNGYWIKGIKYTSRKSYDIGSLFRDTLRD